MQVQVLDVDYIMNSNKPIVRMFCKTEDGKSVCLYYENFLPYFYARGDENRIKGVLREYKSEVKNVEKVKKFPALGFQPEPSEFFKITITTPSKTPEIRDKLKNAGVHCYEADILFKYRFMVDFDIYGMDWLDVKVKKVQSTVSKIPTFEIVEMKKVEHPKNAPLKYLSFDIETYTKTDKIDDYYNNRIILISLYFSPSYRKSKSLVLAAKPISGNGIIGCKDEKEMLEKFIDIINDFDPDIITGYNIDNFDIPFVISRMKQLGVKPYLGRTEDKEAYVRKFGVGTSVTITGRVVVDPYLIIKQDPYTKFIRYDLTTVATNMIGDKKMDVAHSEINGLWDGSKQQQIKLAEYCRKDSELALRIVQEKKLLDKFLELSKLSGVLLQDSMAGQTTRIEVKILHEFKKHDILMPSRPSEAEMRRRDKERKTEGLTGATVLEPVTGLHADTCTIVLDFHSLYPSLIRTFNICPTTVILDKKYTNFKHHNSPKGAMFVDEDVRKGIMPKILGELLETRFAIKRQMKKEIDPEKRAYMNAKQLAIKILANSFYGYTGYIRARLYLMEVASSITSYGRDNIQKTKKIVEEKFGLKVIYGDTDSVFIKTKTSNVDNAAEEAKKIASYVSSQLPGYLELGFDKLYRTFLILTKKRYAGWKFDKVGGKWVKKIDMKGIETVRRDWCKLVTNVMNEILKIILIDGDVKKAIGIFRETVDKLKRNEIPVEDLAIFKGITKSPDKYDGLMPHIELAKKMMRRNPAEAPKVGDRIGYVIIRGNEMLSKRAEDPKYIKEHNIEIDSNYYINNQLLPPIERLFEAIGVSRDELLGHGRQVNMFDVFSKKKRVLNHTINVEYNEKSKSENRKKDDEKELDSWEEFICSKCGKSFRRMPLSGKCDVCGGDVIISSHGSSGKAAHQKFE